MSAEQTVLNAVQRAQDILAHYVEPGPRHAEQTINELMTILDDSEVVKAVWELDPKSKPDEE
jgi:hypothetical protein